MFNVIVSSDPRYPVNKNAIQTTVQDVLHRYKINSQVEIGISIIGDRKMHEINRKYRGLDSTTNILTFAMEDATVITHLRGFGFVPAPDQILPMGDILISYPQAKEDARVEGVTVDDEINFLVEHGVKHLLGLHHHEH